MKSKGRHRDKTKASPEGKGQRLVFRLQEYQRLEEAFTPWRGIIPSAGDGWMVGQVISGRERASVGQATGSECHPSGEHRHQGILSLTQRRVLWRIRARECHGNHMTARECCLNHMTARECRRNHMTARECHKKSHDNLGMPQKSHHETDLTQEIY